MPLGTLRDKVLFGIARKRGSIHRYTVIRWVVGVVFTALVAALPLLDILRFDFWGGRHVVLGEEVGLVEAAKAFAFPFLAVNVVIIVASRFVGRYLCGFVCPHGALSRFAEWFRFYGKTRRQRFLGTAAMFLVCLLLGAITFSFWVDWRVFAEGSPLAIALSAGFLASVTLGLYGLLHFLGLRFCREFCPSGVYFALLGTETFNGVQLSHPETCTDCGACTKVCPMDLEPKYITGGERRGGMGFYPESLTNAALCIRCGDCVNVCEGVKRDATVPTALSMGWLPRAGEEEDAAQGQPPAPAEPASEAQDDEEAAAVAPPARRARA
jgi:polyferredoxin